jgi:hypothetical protein
MVFIGCFIAELIEKKELPGKNVVLKELTQEMTYVFILNGRIY